MMQFVRRLVGPGLRKLLAALNFLRSLLVLSSGQSLICFRQHIFQNLHHLSSQCFLKKTISWSPLNFKTSKQLSLQLLTSETRTPKKTCDVFFLACMKLVTIIISYSYLHSYCCFVSALCQPRSISSSHRPSSHWFRSRCRPCGRCATFQLTRPVYDQSFPLFG